MKILLRTLTGLSKFDLGKYKDQKIETVVKLEPQYICYVYFSMSNLSFTDEILLAAGITEEYRITKPGTSNEMHHKFNLDKITQMTDGEKHKHFRSQQKKRIKQAKLLHSRHVNDDRKILSKQSLKNMNNYNTRLDLNYRTTDWKSDKK